MPCLGKGIREALIVNVRNQPARSTMKRQEGDPQRACASRGAQSGGVGSRRKAAGMAVPRQAMASAVREIGKVNMK